MRPPDTVGEMVVADGPPGVAQDKLGHLFKRFYRAEESHSRVSGQQPHLGESTDATPSAAWCMRGKPHCQGAVSA